MSLSNSQTVSSPIAAEELPAARWGAVLFRNRSWLPVPFLLIAVLAPGSMTPLEWIAGGLLIAIGEGIRLAGVAAAGTVTRRRSRDVQRLVTYGAFSYARNPLYIGNFLIWMGVVVTSAVYWLIPIAILVFAIEYTLIVAYEEAVLESTFGQEYLDYKARTPRWIPRSFTAPERGPHDWGEAWRSESSTFLQYATLAVVFSAKELFIPGT